MSPSHGATAEGSSSSSTSTSSSSTSTSGSSTSGGGPSGSPRWMQGAPGVPPWERGPGAPRDPPEGEGPGGTSMGDIIPLEEGEEGLMRSAGAGETMGWGDGPGLAGMVGMGGMGGMGGVAFPKSSSAASASASVGGSGWAEPLSAGGAPWGYPRDISSGAEHARWHHCARGGE